MEEKERGSILISKKWYKRWWAIVGFCFVGIIILFSPLYIYQVYKVYHQMKAGGYLTVEDLSREAPYSMDYIVNSMSPWKGNEAAEIQIVEFGDFNCSRCLQAFNIMRELEGKYHDKIKFYWRNYPVVSGSSIEMAKGGVCAHQQGKFWLYHDRMFQLQGQINEENLAETVQTFGLDKKKFEDCLVNDLTLAQIKKDYFAAKEGEVSGTPTFFINGYKLQGVVPLTNWIDVVEKFLAIYENNAGN